MSYKLQFLLIFLGAFLSWGVGKLRCEKSSTATGMSSVPYGESLSWEHSPHIAGEVYQKGICCPLQEKPPQGYLMRVEGTSRILRLHRCSAQGSLMHATG